MKMYLCEKLHCQFLDSQTSNGKYDFFLDFRFSKNIYIYYLFIQDYYYFIFLLK
jgi:hypothetical protein